MVARIDYGLGRRSLTALLTCTERGCNYRSSYSARLLWNRVQPVQRSTNNARLQDRRFPHTYATHIKADGIPGKMTLPIYPPLVSLPY